MKSKFEDTSIKDHWTSQALRHGSSHKASWADTHAIELEKRVIRPYLREQTSVLDIGCANGHATLAYASMLDIDITGVDYIPEMIAAANEALDGLASPLKGRARFQAGDIQALAFADQTFDTVLTTRVVINLQNRQNQRVGIKECLRVTKSGGMVILSEATLEGLEAVNRLRQELGMKPLSMPAFNLYLDEALVLDAAREEGAEMEMIDFSSTYYLMTRVLKPMLEHLPGSLVKAADPASEVNRLASVLPSWGGYGVQRLFILHKNK